MKKYLIGFGLAVIFFAGFSSVQAEDSTSWKPVYIDNVDSYNACKDAGGTWITVPLTDHPKGKACLKTKDEGASCDTLNFDTIKDFEDIEVLQLGKNYQVDISKVEYENGYYIKNGDKKLEVVECYENNKLEKKLKTKEKPTGSNVCLIKNNDALRIKAIDFSRDSYPEWYCPYNWSGQYPKDANPYNPEDDYFKNKLKDSVYKFEVEDSSELTHDCARRIFALGKACADRVERTTDVVDKIKQLRRDFYRKKSIELWRDTEKLLGDAKGIDAYHQWLEIKDMTFKKICGAKNGECNESVYKDDKGKDKFGKDKTDAIKAAQEWITTKELMTDSKTPAKYFEELAQEEWKKDDTTADNVKKVLKKKVDEIWGGSTTDNDDQKKLKNYMGGVYEDKDFKFGNNEWAGADPAKKKYSELLADANAKNHSATLVSKYISRRSNDLNVAVSNDQTSHIEVTKLLRAYGDGEEKGSSREADLMVFDDKKKGDKMINVFDKIILLAVRTMGTLAILLLIISGVIMVVSSGEEDRLSQAKSVFIYTLVGLIVGFLSYTIVRFVIDTLLS